MVGKANELAGMNRFSACNPMLSGMNVVTPVAMELVAIDFDSDVIR